MPTKTWVVGEEVLAADFNSYVQKQVVSTFANAAARDAAIPAPVPGMVCYLTDVGLLLQYTDKSAPPAWRKPWGQPWGEVQKLDPSQPATTGPVVVSGSTFTMPLIGRRYRVSFHCTATQNASLGAAKYTFQIGPSLLTSATMWLAANYVGQIALVETFSGQASGTTGFVVVQTSAGTVTTDWARLMVDDVGPV